MREQAELGAALWRASSRVRDADAFHACLPLALRQWLAQHGMQLHLSASTRCHPPPCPPRSAMPGFIAVRLCPRLIFVTPNFDKYRRASEATR